MTDPTPNLEEQKTILMDAFLDALYENSVKLFVTAAAEPEDLYTAGDGAFEFERTVSRLIETQSPEYIAQPHGGED